MGKVIGIDLGTGLSCCGAIEGKEVRVIENADGARTTPSIVAFTDDGRLIGQAAKNQAITNPTRTIRCIKRLIGRKRFEVAEDEKLLPYKIVGEPQDDAQIEIDGKAYHPVQISAMILSELKRSAERHFGEPVTQCVLCCPAYFGDAQRAATKEAGRIAGLEVLRLLSEPTAAALAYGIANDKDQKIIVIDPGSGTHDCTVLRTGDGLYEVIATSGDTRLGGTDFDNMLVAFVADEFKQSSGVDIRQDPMALQRLTEACEKAKCDLSNVLQTNINLPYISAVGGVPKHLTQVITRAKFEQICAPLFDRLRAPIMRVLEDAKLLPSQIQEVVLVGGSSRIPKFQDMCREIFGREPHRGVNPDEAIAIGAARQSGVLSGDITGIVLVDVTPLSLGVETLGGVSSVLVPRNTAIPHRKSEVYTTASDNQAVVDVHVLQGEHRLVAGNRTIGRFQMQGIFPAKRGIPQIEVIFDLDANGILSVTARDQQSGKEHKVEIKGSSGLQKADIDRMVAEASANAAEEGAKVELIEQRNSADNLAYQSEAFLSENIKNIMPPTQEAVKAAVANVKKALADNLPQDAIASAVGALETANTAMYEQTYGQSNQAKPVTPPPQPTPPPPPPPPAVKPSNMDVPGDAINGDFKPL